MKLFEEYQALQQQVFAYFGYVEDWRVLPIVFDTEMYWAEDGDQVVFAEDKESLFDGEGNFYANEIYHQRHLKQWVYRGEDYTMICVDTHTDGNQYLQVFSNDLELSDDIPAFNEV